MRALRFGSYSMAATLAGTPSLSRRKSIDAVLLLVAAAAVPRGHAAVGVAAAGAAASGASERLLRAVAGDLGEVGDGLEPAPGAGGLALADGHRSAPEDLDAVALGERSRWPASWSGRVPNVPVRRLRLRLPLRLSVFTFVTRRRRSPRPRGGSRSCWRRARRRTCRRCSSSRRVRLLRHDRPEDDVARVLHAAASVVSARHRSASGLELDAVGTTAADRRAAAERAVQGGPGEDDPVVDEHVVGVELLGEHDLHPLAEVAERLPGDLVVAVRARPAPGAARRPVERRFEDGDARPWSSAARDAQSSTTTTLPSAARSDSAERSARRTIFFGVRWR